MLTLILSRLSWKICWMSPYILQSNQGSRQRLVQHGRALASLQRKPSPTTTKRRFLQVPSVLEQVQGRPQLRLMETQPE